METESYMLFIIVEGGWGSDRRCFVMLFISCYSLLFGVYKPFAVLLTLAALSQYPSFANPERDSPQSPDL